MLDHFLKVAYANEVQQEEDARLSALLQQLPVEDLQKIASIGMLCSNGAEGSVGGFIGQFAGSPLLQQALQLEQEELQAEMLRVERGIEDEARQREMDANGSSWRRMDEIRIRKRLLELELAKERLSNGAPAPAAEAPAPADPAGPPVDVASKTAANEEEDARAQQRDPNSRALPAGASTALKGALVGGALGHIGGELTGGSRTPLLRAGGALAGILLGGVAGARRHRKSGAGKVDKNYEYANGGAFGGLQGALAGGLVGGPVGAGLGGLTGLTLGRGTTPASAARADAYRALDRAQKTASGVDAIAREFSAPSTEESVRKRQSDPRYHAVPAGHQGGLAGAALGGALGHFGGMAAEHWSGRGGLRMPLRVGGAVLGGVLGHTRGEQLHRGTADGRVDGAHAYVSGPEELTLRGAVAGGMLAGPLGAGIGALMGNLAGEGATTPESITRANAYKALEKQKTSSDLADSWGRELAQREAKTAGIGGMLGGLAKANPGALIGAGLGAAGGLANGLQKDQNGQRHIMSGLAQGAMGAAAGGLAGHAAQNIGSAVQGGATLGAAAKGYGTNMLGKAQAQIPGIVDKAKGVVGSAQGKLQGMLGKTPGTGTLVSAT